MAKNLKKILSESAGLSNEDQQQINEAWEVKLSEARDEITSELREEFARKFEHDKNILAEAMDNFLNDKLRVELEEFAEDRRNLAEERVAYKSNIKAHTGVLNKFITEQLTSEVKELRTDKKLMNEKFKKLENFLLKQLSEEIREFRSDKNELVAQKVKMVREGKAYLTSTKREFIKRASKVVEANLNKVLRTELSQFKDDIKEAKNNDFGRRIFEAFAGEYMSSYLNEGTEVSKLQKVIATKDDEITTIKESVKQKVKLAEGLNNKLSAAKDRISRDKVMAELLNPLSKDKKGVMGELLESVQTKDLERAYNKYLPAVLNESTPRKAQKRSKTINESAKLSTKTGDRATTALQEGIDNDFNSELNDLKALAGLK